MLLSILGIGPLLITRALISLLTSFLIVVFCGKRFIAFLKKHQSIGQPIRQDGPQSHLLTKKGTPTMGGVLLLLSCIFSTLLWADLSNIFILLILFVLVVYGVTGFIDDYVKVTKKTTNAMTAKMKLLIQFATSFFVVIILSYNSVDNLKYSLYIPYINTIINLNIFYIIFGMIVITGTSNAVNLSDGLDGLAGGLCVFAFLGFAIITYILGNSPVSGINQIFVPNSAEVMIVCAAICGACLGFLWYNSHPAKVFMGDTGSLALGAALGSIAVIIRQELLLIIIGIVFVIEALSVIIQVFWYKRTKKRIFLMAPFHHHLEQLGIKETTVVARLCIVGFIGTLIGLSSLLF